MTAPSLIIDDVGEGDLAFFTKHKRAKTRVRAAFAGEFSKEILEQARGRAALVIVAVERNSDGRPVRVAKGLAFADGGTA